MKNHSMKKGFDQAKFAPCLFHRTVQFPKRFVVFATGYSHPCDKRIRAFAFHTFGAPDYSGNRRLLLHRIDLPFISICRTRHFILTMVVRLFFTSAIVVVVPFASCKFHDVPIWKKACSLFSKHIKLD